MRGSAKALHCLYLVGMARVPYCIVKCKAKHSQEKGDQSQMLVGNNAVKAKRVKFHKLADHPIGISADPKGDGQVVAQFRHHRSRAVNNYNGDGQRGDDHYNTQRFPQAQDDPTPILTRVRPMKRYVCWVMVSTVEP
jgi:hypothetical protein